MTSVQHHRYSDYSNLYDDGYDDFVARKVKKMAKVKENQFSYCSGCGSRQMIGGKCRKCGYEPGKKTTKTDTEKTATKTKAGTKKNTKKTKPETEK